mgnify:FL=1
MSKLWTIKKILEWTKEYFADKGVENPRLDAEILLCNVLNCGRINLFLDQDRPLIDAELSKYKAYVLRRAQHEPIAYILGEKAFMKNNFKVTPATLIPRPETELLVESIARVAPLLKLEGDVKILDIGTGSGAIIVSLLDLLPRAKGVGVDISLEALIVAKENAERIGVKERCGFVRSDLFSKLPLDKKFDIIVSNPPYIPLADMEGLAEDVKKEPVTALLGGADGLDFYRKIIAEASSHMEEEGLLAFEVGIHEAQEVAKLCLKAGFKNTSIRKDYAGIERMVFAVKSPEENKYENLLLEASRAL